MGGIYERGLLEAGYGYIMEIYIQPMYKKGFGTAVYKHNLQMLKNMKLKIYI